MAEPEKLIPLHGGCRKLKSFQVAQLGYDVTVRFCDRYLEKRSRNQAALLAKLLSGELRLTDSPKRLRRFHARRIIDATDPSK